MFITIDSYPEFEQDIEQAWKDVIEKYHFEIFPITESQVVLKNEKSKVLFILGTSDRIGIVIENPKTGVIYDRTSLYMFFNLDFLDRIVVGHKEYPLPKDLWFDYIREENYRAISRTDLPIIKKEVLSNWLPLIKGDFSCEKEYLAWKKWAYQPNQKRKSMDELSYNSYKKEMINK